MGGMDTLLLMQPVAFAATVASAQNPKGVVNPPETVPFQ
jgi:hypothetical protein